MQSQREQRKVRSHPLLLSSVMSDSTKGEGGLWGVGHCFTSDTQFMQIPLLPNRSAQGKTILQNIVPGLNELTEHKPTQILRISG